MNTMATYTIHLLYTVSPCLLEFLQESALFWDTVYNLGRLFCSQLIIICLNHWNGLSILPWCNKPLKYLKGQMTDGKHLWNSSTWFNIIPFIRHWFHLHVCNKGRSLYMNKQLIMKALKFHSRSGQSAEKDSNQW